MAIANAPSDICFVVMPFGTKPLNDGSNRTFDFDKVYRVLIQRAVKLARLTPLRADEQVGSQVIHLDMFKSLRDTATVLADLSTTNPNVFYELGIRHVMSPRGTVLMCRQGTELPFDVKLSRVVFYKYDGVSLDWEEVERVVVELKAALEEARRGPPDSPVHALLEGVYAAGPLSTRFAPSSTYGDLNGTRRYDVYQQLVASHWQQSSQDLSDLRERHGLCPFGSRAVGHYCLRQDPVSTETSAVVNDLYNCEQYDLANRIFKKLEQAQELDISQMLRYGSSLSEADQTETGALSGLKYADKAIQAGELRLTESNPTAKDHETAFNAYCNRSGLHFWLFILTQADSSLQAAIDSMNKALSYAAQATAGNETFPLGRSAQAHLKLLLMLRLSDKNLHRDDTEDHAAAILGISPSLSTPPDSVSYLEWYQAIAWADRGHEKNAYELTIRRVREDAKLMNERDSFGIGRRQYSQLRRFIEQYASMLRHPTLVGRISQALQSGR